MVEEESRRTRLEDWHRKRCFDAPVLMLERHVTIIYFASGGCGSDTRGGDIKVMWMIDNHPHH